MQRVFFTYLGVDQAVKDAQFDQRFGEYFVQPLPEGCTMGRVMKSHESDTAKAARHV